MDSGQRFLAWWGGQPPSRKRMYIITALAVLVSVASAFYYTTRTTYVPLFSGLDTAQLNSLIVSLQKENVSYKVSDAGTSILVPSGMVHELKIRIAGEGLFNSGIGFEIFDSMKLGITDFERRLNYQRALQEELRRSISHFPEVEQARVHLVIPEQSVFLQQSQQASASITLKLRPFRTLSPESTKAMVYLVALSVPNLQPDRVSIIDVAGRILSDGLALAGSDQSPNALRQSESQRSFEKELEHKLIHMLERIYGPGQAVAVVTASLNFDQETVTRITYDNDGRVIRSEQVRQETYSSTAGEEGGGFPGTGSNIPFYPGGTDGGNGNTTSYDSSDRTTHYEIDTTQSTVITAPGRLIHLSTAVSVNSELNEDQKEELGRLVSAAIGYSPIRGDSLVVSALNFNLEHIERAQEALSEQIKSDQTRQYIQYAIWGVGALLGFIVLMIIVSRVSKALKFEVPQPVPVHLMPIQQAIEEAAAAKSTSESQVALSKIKELAKSNPDEVAMLVKAWFKES